MPAGDTHRIRVKHSLSSIFRIFTVALVVGTCLLATTLTVVLETRARDHDSARAVSGLTRSVATILGQDLRDGELKRLETLADSIQTSERVESIGVIDANGAYIFGSSAAFIDPQLSEVLALNALTTEQSMTERVADRWIVANVIRFENETIGVVILEAQRITKAPVIWTALKWGFVALVAVLIVVVPVSELMIRHLMRPLNALTAFAAGMSVNHLSQRIHINTGNEFEMLSNAFNKMIERLDRSMRRVQRLAYIDQLTGLPNRERYYRDLTECLGNMRPGHNVAVIMLDIERFRWINETLGPQLGDQALVVIGKRLRRALASADKVVRLQNGQKKPSMIARFAADEFGVLIPGVETKDQIGRILQMIHAAMRQPVELGDHKLTIGITAGIALGPDDGKTKEELLKNADLALKEAKRDGAGKAKFFTQKLNQAAQNRLRLENEVRHGIENREFFAYFQPKIDFQTGEIVGAEALARWRRASGEVISPGIFIPIAEELGIIGGIGDLIMEDACREATIWMQQGFDCKVAVNVSPLQFEDTGFSDKVLDRLRDAGLPPGRLELEVTETLAVADPDKVSEIMRPLRAMGVRLAIDDFGAGHSNLVTLTRLPFDVFKIDQQFVRALHSDKQAPAIVEMILAMAEAMGLETIAEGVETQSQSDFLRRRGCTIAQGYLYSPPLSADDFLVFLNNWQAFGDKPASWTSIAS